MLQVLRQVFGIDEHPSPMTPAEVALLQDDFAPNVLLKHAPPLHMEAVTNAIMEISNNAYEEQVFLVGDGSQVSADDYPDLDRSFRFIWVRSLAGGGSAKEFTNQGADIMVVAGPDTSSKTTFLQVAAWDPHHGWFNFYERQKPDELSDPDDLQQWVWNGNSTHAFGELSRNKGPFMGHINGSLVMKELRQPWNNWHSSEATIRVPEGSPLAENRFFQQKEQANALERLVESAITAWTESRLTKALRDDGKITDQAMGSPQMLLQHLLKTTTVNFISSKTRSKQRPTSSAAIDLPLSFFFNVEGLSMPQLGLDKLDLETDGKYTVKVDVYLKVLERMHMHLMGYNSNGNLIRIPEDPNQYRDTFFAFLVPQPATEDTQVVRALLDRKVLSKQFVLCSWMVDFCNPVYSPLRVVLMQYVPQDGTVGKWDEIEDKTVENILKGAAAGDTAAQCFQTWWDIGIAGGYEALADAAVNAIKGYLNEVDKKCRELEGFAMYSKLAEWRRRAFAGYNRALDEFPLTFPRTNIPANAPALEMTATGDVVDIPQAHLDVLLPTLVKRTVRCQGSSARGCPR